MAVKKKINVVETGEKKSLRYYRYINWNLQGRHYGITEKKAIIQLNCLIYELLSKGTEIKVSKLDVPFHVLHISLQ